jgi:hypothetical protein
VKSAYLVKLMEFSALERKEEIKMSEASEIID